MIKGSFCGLILVITGLGFLTQHFSYL